MTPTTTSCIAHGAR